MNYNSTVLSSRLKLLLANLYNASSKLRRNSTLLRYTVGNVTGCDSATQVCATKAPTTWAPSARPSPAPSVVPPTAAPTSPRTDSPTGVPTEEPTDFPTADPTEEPTPTPTEQPTLPPPSNFTVLRLDVGANKSTTDSSGNVWDGDANYKTSGFGSGLPADVTTFVGNATTLSSVQKTNVSSGLASVYTTCRYWSRAAAPRTVFEAYRFSNLTAGMYVVRFHLLVKSTDNLNFSIYVNNFSAAPVLTFTPPTSAQGSGTSHARPLTWPAPFWAVFDARCSGPCLQHAGQVQLHVAAGPRPQQHGGRNQRHRCRPG
jgi:hypothetical protein